MKIVLIRSPKALAPILRKIFADGYMFYGIKEKNEKELLNINHYEDYLNLLD